MPIVNFILGYYYISKAECEDDFGFVWDMQRFARLTTEKVTDTLEEVYRHWYRTSHWPGNCFKQITQKLHELGAEKLDRPN